MSVLAGQEEVGVSEKSFKDIFFFLFWKLRNTNCMEVFLSFSVEKTWTIVSATSFKLVIKAITEVTWIVNHLKMYITNIYELQIVIIYHSIFPLSKH